MNKELIKHKDGTCTIVMNNLNKAEWERLKKNFSLKEEEIKSVETLLSGFSKVYLTIMLGDDIEVNVSTGIMLCADKDKWDFRYCITLTKDIL